MKQRKIAVTCFENTIGMRFCSIPSGSFLMGQQDGDSDEKPTHTVRITQPFAISETPVTNSQYEGFDPGHGAMRGIRNLSSGNNEAVTHVSYEDANAFCRWLSFTEGKPYRLPTEAEWEYVCRAGTSTEFYTGDKLPADMQRAQKNTRVPEPVSLEVRTTEPNAFGVYDMHGLVEEWCYDWYGPYGPDEQSDPVGYRDGESRVTRGGSYCTDTYYLRSASRMAALPQDRSWIIGFRVVLGEMPATKELSRTSTPRFAQEVNQKSFKWKCTEEAAFMGPIPFVREPEDNTPFYNHNHCPSITWCPNGDLLAIWFSCRTEAGREMTILSSRLRMGANQWEPASVFFDLPDRNTTGSSLFHGTDGSLLHINGVGVSYGWMDLAMILRASYDNGATWSKPVLINPNHQFRNQPVSGAFATNDGRLIQICDATSGSVGGSALHISYDGGRSWIDFGARMPSPDFMEGKVGAWIAGIHAGVVELDDGRLLALGRGNDIDGQMPMSVSSDGGRSWVYRASPFPPIASGQRLVLMKLLQGPVLLVSFTDHSDIYRKLGEDGKRRQPIGMNFVNKNDRVFHGDGMFAALSWDGGDTWPVKRLLTPGGNEREIDGGAWTGMFTINESRAEPMGYLAATQTPDGLINLISSKQHYRFNLAWLTQYV